MKVDQLPYEYWSVIFMFIYFTFCILYTDQIGSILCANVTIVWSMDYIYLNLLTIAGVCFLSSVQSPQ